MTTRRLGAADAVFVLRERPPGLRPVPARDAAIAILAGGFLDESDGVRAGPARVFDLTEYQADAVERAREIVRRRRGVLIADGVGLGKTYIGLALAEHALRDGGRVAVITPAALRREWRRPLARLAGRLRVAEHPGIALEAGSARPAERRPAARTRRAEQSLLAWFSHTRLSRGTHSPERLGRLDWVIVDEAHAFRSPRTRRYRALARLCHGARVVLLTATPVNNSLWDLYHLVRLFAGNGAFHDLAVPDLFEAIRAADLQGSGAGDGQVGRVLREVAIRRTRAFLRRHYGGVRVPGRGTPVVRTFPAHAAPVPVRYTLDDVDPGLCDDAVETVRSLSFAPLRLGEYGAALEPRGGAEIELLRLVLTKRLESSAAAFAESVRRQLAFYDAFSRALARGRVVAPAEHRALYGRRADGDAQLVLEDLALRPVPAGLDADRLAADAESDRVRLRQLHRRLASRAGEADPKLAALRALLAGELAGEKVVLFTEFRDTARYLWCELAGRGGVALVDGAGAYLGRLPAGRRVVIDRFAPRSNGARIPPDRERVDLLIATDVLAEGLNLQDAARVVSYDLPWNPVKLIQRVGRIDRLGSPHPLIHTYYFLPEDGLESIIRLVQRLRRKLVAIGRGVGADTAVLSAAQEVTRDFNAFVARLAAGDAAVLEDAEPSETALLEQDERLRAAFRAARASACPDRGVTPAGIPHGAVTAPAGSAPEVLVGATLNAEPLLLLYDPRTTDVREDRTAAERILLAALEPEAASVAPTPVLGHAALAAARPALAARAALAGAPEPLRPNAPGTRAARRLLDVLAATPGGPGPEACARADRVLEALSRQPPAGTEDGIRNLLARPAQSGAPDGLWSLLSALEAVLELDYSPGQPHAAFPRKRSRHRAAGVGADQYRAGASSGLVILGVIESVPAASGSHPGVDAPGTPDPTSD